MKKLIALTMVLALLLSGCGGAKAEPTAAAPETTPAPTVTEAPTEAATEPTTVPTTEPAPVYTNPLNGEILDAPFTGRIFASTVSNVASALPHVGVNQADIIMEMFVNGSNVRCLALYTDVTKAPVIGSVRSLRLMFIDLAEHYDLIVADAGGSPYVLNEASERGTERINLGDGGTYYSFRDADRKRQLGYEHSLMANGDQLPARAQELGYETTRPEDADYGFRFTENGTPENGEAAETISILMTYHWTSDTSTKTTTMIYDSELGKYVWNQHDQEMVDAGDGQREAFTNVLVVYAPISTKSGSGTSYHVADFLAGGTGYYANGGKIVPITWSCDGDFEPLRFYNEDGSDLLLGTGTTYISIIPDYSPVTYSAGE